MVYIVLYFLILYCINIVLLVFQHHIIEFYLSTLQYFFLLFLETIAPWNFSTRELAPSSIV